MKGIFNMLINNIPPIQHVRPIHQIQSSVNTLGDPAVEQRVPGDIFADALRKAVRNIHELSAESDRQRTKALLGETDELHTALIAGQRSALAQDLFIQARNRLMDVHSEIMRIQL